jgi:hypothetical protein
MSQGESRENSAIGPTISMSKGYGEYLDPGYRTSSSKGPQEALQLVFAMLNPRSRKPRLSIIQAMIAFQVPFRSDIAVKPGIL